MHRHVPISVQFFFRCTCTWIELNCIAQCIVFVPSANSRQLPRVCVSLFVWTYESMYMLDGSYECTSPICIFQWYWLLLLFSLLLGHDFVTLFFSVNRPHSQHQTVCVRPLLVCDYCCGLRDREWISAGLFGVLWVPDTLTGPIWRKMSEPNPISMLPFIESTHTQPIIVRPKWPK